MPAFVNLRKRIFRFGANFIGGRGYLGCRHIFLRQEKIMNYCHAQNEIRDGGIQILKHCADLDVGEWRWPICWHAQA